MKDNISCYTLALTTYMYEVKSALVLTISRYNIQILFLVEFIILWYYIIDAKKVHYIIETKMINSIIYNTL
jgi:hypothetical protein